MSVSHPRPLPQVTSTYIDGLCDIVPNLKRTDSDFRTLLHCLKTVPKECTPFKGKILQHLRVHGLGNPHINLGILSLCFARAATLYRKTPNKSEGALGAWKSSMLGELRALEDNINEIYKTVGLTSNYIIDKDTTDDVILKPVGKLTESNQDFEGLINEYLLRVNLAAHNICALISVPTDFSLPIPVLVLLRMATKVGSIRWKDYKKKPDGLIRNHAYSLTPYLIKIQLMIFRRVTDVLSTGIIPFTPYINQCQMRILDWTRTSNLSRHDEMMYHQLRSEIFQSISFLIEKLSLNLNLEPKLLQSLMEVELIDYLEDLAKLQELNAYSNNHLIEALRCLEHLLIPYCELFEAPTEKKVKSYIINTCIGIYRNFPSTTFSLACRKHLLKILEIIANQPYASSTTELAQNIFHMAYRIESDPEIKFTAMRTLRLGFAHRPIIVTQHEVYSRYGDWVWMSNEPVHSSPAIDHQGQQVSLQHEINPENIRLKLNTSQNGISDGISAGTPELEVAETDLPFVDASQIPLNLEQSSPKAVRSIDNSDTNALSTNSFDRPVVNGNGDDDIDISDYMNHFVEKPCT